MKLDEPITGIQTGTAKTPLPRYHWKRRATQIAALAVIVLIPLSGLRPFLCGASHQKQ